MRDFGFMGPLILLPCNSVEASRTRRRSIEISATFITILATAWLCTLGLFWALLGLLLAKHILVAILLMHVGLDRETAHPEIDTLLPGNPSQQQGRA